MKPNEYAQAQAWDSMIRIMVVGCLFLSAFMAACSAIVLSILADSGDAILLRSALLVFGTLAFAAGLAFRKIDRLTWKHWSVICLLAAPGAIYMLVH
ncbi:MULTISPECIES: hypothetical protein [Sphingobium]|jgi:hypothetical protein|uniref:hypothetical protein n=1 Tax=Sphingobium TaxID=165695 RepID=UPI001F3D2917|nr:MULTISPECIES: hypothetical protein [Sphingobium]MDG2512169.1 hypothetical protein [Sphingobium yanoikuyae]